MENGSYVAIADKLGFYRFFKRVWEQGDALQWVCVYVEPGQYEGLVVHVETTEGTYTSDEVVFVEWQQRKYFSSLSGFPVMIDSAKFESEKIEGERRPIAYAHFPVEPKGDLVRWFPGR